MHQEAMPALRALTLEAQHSWFPPLPARPPSSKFLSQQPTAAKTQTLNRLGDRGNLLSGGRKQSKAWDAEGNRAPMQQPGLRN